LKPANKYLVNEPAPEMGIKEETLVQKSLEKKPVEIPTDKVEVPKVEPVQDVQDKVETVK